MHQFGQEQVCIILEPGRYNGVRQTHLLICYAARGLAFITRRLSHREMVKSSYEHTYYFHESEAGGLLACDP